jgi:cellobiose-specific phosphotransferase system component IIC
VFYLKEAGLMLINHPGLSADLEITSLYALMASSLLLLPPVAWIASQGGIRPAIEKLEDWLQHRAEPLVGVLALIFAVYLFYEGIHGLEVMAGV